MKEILQICATCRSPKPEKEFCDIRGKHVRYKTCWHCRDIKAGRIEPEEVAAEARAMPSDVAVTCADHASKDCRKCYPIHTMPVPTMRWGRPINVASI